MACVPSANANIDARAAHFFALISMGLVLCILSRTLQACSPKAVINPPMAAAFVDEAQEWRRSGGSVKVGV
jgi:hypothetical protein